MDFLPVFLDVKGKRCLLVGGGDIASRKADLLQRAGAHLYVVATEFNTGLSELLSAGGHLQRRGVFTESDLDGVALAIAATNDEKLNQQVSILAKARNIPVNVVDQPALCSIIFPAVIDRNPVLVAVSSSGSSPVLTRRIKEQIERLLPGTTGELARVLGAIRPAVKSRLKNFQRRLRFWEKVLDSEIPELVYAGNTDSAEKKLAQLLSETETDAGSPVSGEVYLVGAGPGDPDLLTLRALRLMQQADVVLYDRLVSPEIMAKIRPDADKIHVGKQRSHHPVPQEQINDMLVRLAREGKRVLRLKGGDPFIFGRGGEELEKLMEQQIPFQVVPGITAASGCASYAGIPLTHRDHSQAVMFLTGHIVAGEGAPPWESLAGGRHTLVFYMGLLTLADICSQLVSHGMVADMPAALVQQGTTAQQKVIQGTLTSLPGLVASSDVHAPTLLIIGTVVALRDRLNWFTPAQ